MAKPDLRRGFKTEANGHARDLRLEMGLAKDAPLCPRLLAAHLCIPIVPLTHLQASAPEEALRLLKGSESEFFAVTVFDGPKRLIVHNDSVALVRQTSDLAHELAHGILGHTPHPLLGEDGERSFDQTMEDEANWLGPALLVSEEAALRVARVGMTIRQAAAEYGVSTNVMQMRINVTGANKRRRMR